MSEVDTTEGAGGDTTKCVCIVGAGTAGLCALKYCLERGLNAVCFEQSNKLGGTWVYDENVDKEFEEDVQSSMYEGLRTNLPKEIMGFSDFDFAQDENLSFITADKVVDFLESYADHFKLKDHIRFQTEVIRIRPRSHAMPEKKFWEIYVRNNETREYTVDFYDLVFVCNGHYTVPAYPEIENLDLYKGKKLHSHLYRKASNYKDETVLIIGAGPSGVDITFQLNEHANHVFLSHHLSPAPDTDSLDHVTHKPDVVRFTEHGAVFTDGTVETFSTVILCTGYRFSFPFISTDSDVNLTEDFVQPLYKHIINVNYPVMAFIGLPFKVCPAQLFDLQIRFALKYFLEEKQLPSKKEMLEELQQEIETRRADGLPPRRFHEMGKRQFEYYQDLAETAEIEPIKPVICNIMKAIKENHIFELATYRNNCFKVLDDENFNKFECSA